MFSSHLLLILSGIYIQHYQVDRDNPSGQNSSHYSINTKTHTKLTMKITLESFVVLENQPKIIFYFASHLG